MVNHMTPVKLIEHWVILPRAGIFMPFAVLLVFLVWFPVLTQAAILDEEVTKDNLLGRIGEALAAYGIDVTTNLNSREVVRQRLVNPRLGRFPDLPANTLPDSEEILGWEQEYQNGAIGALAIVAPENSRGGDDEIAVQHWLAAQSRFFITFHSDNLSTIEKVQQVVDAYAFQTRLFTGGTAVAEVAEFYSTAANRLALDSQEARRLDSSITELSYLGERVRRGSNSLFNANDESGNNRLARDEPAIFLKESLGDEFNQSTIREIVVPGGVALGETAKLGVSPASLQFTEGRLQLIDVQGKPWELPNTENPTLKALFDFVSRSEQIQSDAIVDIDAEGRVKMTAALRDTDAGFALLAADTQPFNFVRNLDVTKSVIIDTAVEWQLPDSGNVLQFATEFEVRFLSADNMRIAQTRAALQYEYDSAADAVRYIDSWGRQSGQLHENLDYAGLGSSVSTVANYAGWVALFRALHDAQVPFLQGRYAFMKLDKSGRNTPVRYLR